jgi:hypothetical protein
MSSLWEEEEKGKEKGKGKKNNKEENKQVTKKSKRKRDNIFLKRMDGKRDCY